MVSRRLRAALASLALLVLVPAVYAASPPTEATYRRLCRSIELVHVRALFAQQIGPIQLGGSSDCAFASKGAAIAGLRVFLRIDDGDQTLWSHRGDRPYGTFRRLAFAGGRAKWGYQSGRFPSVVDARTGSFTCTLIPDSTGAGLIALRGTSRVAAQAFASRALAICRDVFRAY